MLTIDNLETADEFTEALTMETEFGGRLVYVVANASAVAQFRPLLERGGSGTAEYGPPTLLTPASSFIDRVSGARFRSAVAGEPARIVAQLTEPGDVLPASGTPFTQTLSGSGSVVGTVTGSARVRRSANLQVNAGVFTVIDFDVETFDFGDMWDVSQPTRLTVPVGGDGVYTIGGHAIYGASGTLEHSLWVRLNGATFIGAGPAIGGTAGAAAASVSTLWNAIAGDYFELLSFNNSGLNRILTATSPYSPAFFASRLP